MARTLRAIAQDIKTDWGSKMYFGAVPYVDAMAQLDAPEQMYHQDRGSDIVRYFLSNAKSWRGDKARAVKAELKALIK